MDIGSEDIDRQLNRVKIFPGMPNLRKIPFSTDLYHLFQSTEKQMIYWRIYGFFLNPLKQVTKCCNIFTILADTFPSVLDDHERGTLYEELRRYDVWDPPAHIEAAIEHGNDSGIMISIRISADQYWQKVSHVKTGDELGFRVLAKLSTAMLCIPNGNADSEQIFPQLALTKTTFRSRMAG